MSKSAENPEFQIWRTARDREFIHEGKSVFPPPDWVFVPAGDPGLTRRLKAAGEYWVLVHKRRNRIEALGLWTAAAQLERIQAELAAERADPVWQRRLQSAKRRRDAVQSQYADDFKRAVLAFLAFAPRYAAIAERLAVAVTELAVPVGSGTVARTARIPLEQRAEAAVIAWMRHQTTAYDRLAIARVKGARREVRRELATHSRELLRDYRAGRDIDLEHCPLASRLAASGSAAPAAN